ncbi:MAG TPA: hypothetical protein PK971_14700, partial [Saprospiraceae bacterium]|nr:hypothetical protein [Saprospiraceae bacterium]
MKYLLFVLPSLFLFHACEGQTPARELRLGGKHVVMLLDSAQAAEAITTDRYDHYFDLVNPSEMSIQMRSPLDPDESRAAMLARYRAFLKGDVEGFDDKEAKFVGDVVERVFKTCGEVSAGIFPDTLRLIKTKGNHYGDGVWYTRENCIVVPANELESRKTTPFTTTVFHEVFHIVSRLQAAKRKALYAMIGFEGIGLKRLQLPESLAQRVLYNPDGVDFAQKISIQTEAGERIEAVPIIYSKELGHQPGQDAFFSYLEFNLFPIVAQPDGSWMVKTQDDGFSSPLVMAQLTDFFRQIRDNTGYIIHPDEV